MEGKTIRPIVPKPPVPSLCSGAGTPFPVYSPRASDSEHDDAGSFEALDPRDLLPTPLSSPLSGPTWRLDDDDDDNDKQHHHRQQHQQRQQLEEQQAERFFGSNPQASHLSRLNLAGGGYESDVNNDAAASCITSTAADKSEGNFSTSSSDSALHEGLSVGHQVASFLSMGDVDSIGAIFYDRDVMQQRHHPDLIKPVLRNNNNSNDNNNFDGLRKDSLDLMESGIHRPSAESTACSTACSTPSTRLIPKSPGGRRKFATCGSDATPPHRPSLRNHSQAIVKKLLGRLLNRVPLSLLLEVCSNVVATSVLTGKAVYKITLSSVKAGLAMVAEFAQKIWVYIQALEMSDLHRLMRSLERATVGYVGRVATRKLNEATFVVEEGRKSATKAIQYLAGTTSRSSRGDAGAARTQGVTEDMLSRLDKINKTSKVLDYKEREEGKLVGNERGKKKKIRCRLFAFNQVF